MDKSSTWRMLSTAGLLVGSLALAGCPKRPEAATAAPSAIGPNAAAAPHSVPMQVAPRAAEVPVTRPPAPAESPVAPPLAPRVEAPLEDIFFAFDDATIRSDQQAPLGQDFVYLKAHPELRVRVEGNCDERGTEEYNLALGERRAEAVKQALVAEGIAADRIGTLSYGKEKPFAAGHDEAAWSQNRRDHFTIAAR